MAREILVFFFVLKSSIVDDIQIIFDRVKLEKFLHRDTFLHLYEIGDLDDFFWPETVWYARQRRGALQAVILLYAGFKPPILLALSPKGAAKELHALTLDAVPRLPDLVYGHLTESIYDLLSQFFDMQSYGMHYKMGFQGRDEILVDGEDEIFPASRKDLAEVQALFDHSHPENAFDPKMLGSQPFFVLKHGGRILSAAGVHVFSEKYRVAALGNVITHRSHRGNGYGTRVTGALVNHLKTRVDYIGLNVHKENNPAIRMYEKIGFRIHSEYHEVLMQKKSASVGVKD